MPSKRKKSRFCGILLFVSAVGLGVALGLALARTADTVNSENFIEFSTALPTKILDINGELITEFSSEERREIMNLADIPQHMKDALIAREDRVFFEHGGFSIKAIFRAAVGIFTGRSLGGGSTLTQQIAGALYCDRTQMKISRKLKELWWAIQMERRYSKTEILEIYLNHVYFGGGSYGVSIASKYYFGHDALSLTPAESAILVIQLSNPSYYNPFEHPNRAKERQKDVLDTMVSEGYITKKDADNSFDDYWLEFDYSRTDSSAFFMRSDKAPWFSEYVRRELLDMIYGGEDIYTSGFTVNTTGNLQHLRVAQLVMEKQIEFANKNFKAVDMSERPPRPRAIDNFYSDISPIVDVMSLVFGIDDLKTGIMTRANAVIVEDAKTTTIEGTMVNIENDTGFITAIIGGSKFDQSNQFIRAAQASIQPGSSFKPLYFSAALDRGFTAATQLLDAPTEFTTSAGEQYIPANYSEDWHGTVLLWRALALSYNIPALKVLDEIGFNAAIQRSAALLGLSDDDLKTRGFIPPGYAMGLGTVSVRPVEMARAYAIFANGGKAVTPTAIRSIEDKNGNIILNVEAKVRQSMQNPVQVISPQNSFLMTKILEGSKTIGTLHYGSVNRSSIIERDNTRPEGSKFIYTDNAGKRFEMPIAGKTGTTQDWGDAWAIGYSPYYTSAFWFGFDTPGMSMGMSASGATLAGPPWGDFMRAIHRGLPYKDFPRPQGGVVKAVVCSESGGVPYRWCPKASLWFKSGNVPRAKCDMHDSESMKRDARSADILKNSFYHSGAYLNAYQDEDDFDFDFDLDSYIDGSYMKSGRSKRKSKGENSIESGLVGGDADEGGTIEGGGGEQSGTIGNNREQSGTIRNNR